MAKKKEKEIKKDVGNMNEDSGEVNVISKPKLVHEEE